MARRIDPDLYSAIAARLINDRGPGSKVSPEMRRNIAARFRVSERTVLRVWDLCVECFGKTELLDARGKRAPEEYRRAIIKGISASLGKRELADNAAAMRNERELALREITRKR